MGVYYMVVCDGLKEKIDPIYVGHGGIKFGPMVVGDIGRVVMAVLIRDPDGWGKHGARVVPDHSSEYELAGETYTDVSREAVAFYNDHKPIDVAPIFCCAADGTRFLPDPKSWPWPVRAAEVPKERTLWCLPECSPENGHHPDCPRALRVVFRI